MQTDKKRPVSPFSGSSTGASMMFEPCASDGMKGKWPLKYGEQRERGALWECCTLGPVIEGDIHISCRVRTCV